MTQLEQTARQALLAAEANDFEELAKALAARADAIAEGGIPTPEIVAMGERTLELLQGTVRSSRMESARLTQIQAGLAASMDVHRTLDCLA